MTIIEQLHQRALDRARHENRPHSLIESRRWWQKLCSVYGVGAWGYGYAGGEFTLPKAKGGQQ